MATQKTRVALINYFNVEGEDLGATATTTAVGITYNFVEPDGVDENDKTKYRVTESHSVNFADLPAVILNVASAHGLKQKLSDFYAGSKSAGRDPAEDFLAGLEMMKAGEWITPRKGEGAGPRLSLVLEALLAALAKLGHDVNDADIVQKARDQVSSTEGRKSALANPQVAAFYEQIKAERAAAKAAEAAKAAKEAEGAEETADLGDMLGLG